MKNVIVITGASSGFGQITAHALAKAGHINRPETCVTAIWNPDGSRALALRAMLRYACSDSASDKCFRIFYLNIKTLRR